MKLRIDEKKIERILALMTRKVAVYDSEGICIHTNDKSLLGKELSERILNSSELSFEEGEFYYYTLEYSIDGEGLYIAIENIDQSTEEVFRLFSECIGKVKKPYTIKTLIEDLIFKDFEKEAYAKNITTFGMDRYGSYRIVVYDFTETLGEEELFVLENLLENSILLKSGEKRIVALLNQEDGKVLVDRTVSELQSELFARVTSAVGSRVGDVLNIKDSYNNALDCLEIGKLIDKETNIYYFDDYLLPIIVSKIKYDELETLLGGFNVNYEDIIEDEEVLFTGLKFLENNLSVPLTAEKLYIHRNTLVYRLNKLERDVGLDLRKFKDALIFYLMYTKNVLKRDV